MGWTAQVLLLVMQYFSVLYSVQNESGAQAASYPMGIVGKAAGGVKLTTHLYLVPRSGMLDIYLNSLISLHDGNDSVF
jgi:hypothetical protein